MLRRLGALLLPALALLLLGAHFFRAGLIPFAAACVALLALLFVRARWAGSVLQVALVLGVDDLLGRVRGFAHELDKQGGGMGNVGTLFAEQLEEVRNLREDPLQDPLGEGEFSGASVRHD